MWLYEGPNETTRVHPEELAEKDVRAKIKAITCARDNPQGARLVVGSKLGLEGGD